jgi:hypothetical protein
LHLFDAYYGIIGKGQGHKDSHGPCLPWQHISRQNEGMCRWFEQASTARQIWTKPPACENTPA